jgi:lipopolysaccharide export LptBFGC system permease protein LptF
MMPMVTIFAMPIAAMLAVGITVGNLFVRDELLLFNYFPSVMRQLSRSVIIFSIILSALYLPIVFTFAPQGYWEGKRFLIKSAQLHIENLPAQEFHTMTSRCTIFFKKKIVEKDKTIFKELLLMTKEKSGKQYLTTAKEGLLEEGCLNLLQGTIYNHATENHRIASFKKFMFNFEEMFFESDNSLLKPTKCMTLKELFASKVTVSQWQELHKRLIQIVWMLFFPILMLWLMLLLGRAKSNVLLSVVITGGLFLFSYITANMAHFFLSPVWYKLFTFYSLPFIVLLVVYAKKRRSSV